MIVEKLCCAVPAPEDAEGVALEAPSQAGKQSKGKGAETTVVAASPRRVAGASETDTMQGKHHCLHFHGSKTLYTVAKPVLFTKLLTCVDCHCCADHTCA